MQSIVLGAEALINLKAAVRRAHRLLSTVLGDAEEGVGSKPPSDGASEAFGADLRQEIAQGQVLIAVRHFGFLHCVKLPSTRFAVQLSFT